MRRCRNLVAVVGRNFRLELAGSPYFDDHREDSGVCSLCPMIVAPGRELELTREHLCVQVEFGLGHPASAHSGAFHESAVLPACTITVHVSAVDGAASASAGHRAAASQCRGSVHVGLLPFATTAGKQPAQPQPQ